MNQQTQMGISIKYESGTIFRGARPVEDIIAEFSEKKIPHVAVDPATQKYGSWDIVIAFEKQENFEKYSTGELTIPGEWLGMTQAKAQKVNPLKASKRAAGK